MSAAGAWLKAKLSRVTSSGEVIPEIDGFRFLAILSVILHHLLSTYLETTHRLGVERLPLHWRMARDQSGVVAALYPTWFGVELFFVISGFVLGLPFARHYREGARAPQLSSYYLRRLTRIEPPYVLCLVACALYYYLYNAGWRGFIPHFWASLFYLHNIVYGQASWLAGVFWSLEIEVQFYVLAPALAAIFAIRDDVRRRLALAAMVVGWSVAGFYGFQQRTPRWISVTLLGYGQFFVAGFLLVEIYMARLAARRAAPAWSWDAVAIAAAGAMWVILRGHWLWFWALPLLIVALYVALFQGRIGGAFVRATPVWVLGGMCYTTYLYHLPVIQLFGKWTMKWSQPGLPLALDLLIQAAILVPLVFAICAVLFYYTEKPFMRWRWRPQWQWSWRWPVVTAVTAGHPVAGDTGSGYEQGRFEEAMDTPPRARALAAHPAPGAGDLLRRQPLDRG